MPIILPPITRRQFIQRSLALGGTAMMASRAWAATDSERVGLDPNRVALLADTHISADPNSVFPGTKWPGSPVGEGEHESVNMAGCLAVAAKGVLALNPRPAHLIVNGDCALSNGKEAEYKEFLRLVEPTSCCGHHRSCDDWQSRQSGEFVEIAAVPEARADGRAGGCD